MAACLLVNACAAVGERTADQGDTRPFDPPLPINTEPKRLALGGSFAVGVKADGTVWSWGSQSCGRLGVGEMWAGTTNIPTKLSGMTDFVEVAAGSSHVIALRKDGTVWTWGDNKEGQLGYKEDGYYYKATTAQYKDMYYPCQLSPKQVPGLKDIVSVAAGIVSLALDAKGGIWVWGGESYLHKAASCVDCSRNKPHLIYKNAAIKKMIVFGDKIGLIFLDGASVMFGGRIGGLTEIDDKITAEMANGVVYKIPFSNVVDISIAGPTYEVLRNDGTVWSLGLNHDGLLGQCDFKPHAGFVQVKNLNRIKKIKGVMAWDEQGYVWVWGVDVYDSGRKYTSTSSGYGEESCPIRTKQIANLSFFVESPYKTIFGLSNGQLFEWGARTSKAHLIPVPWTWK